jgi:hypothetical protein
VIVGMIVFGTLFAIRSSPYRHFIVSNIREDGASLDVGFTA